MTEAWTHDERLEIVAELQSMDPSIVERVSPGLRTALDDYQVAKADPDQQPVGSVREGNGS